MGRWKLSALLVVILVSALLVLDALEGLAPSRVHTNEVNAAGAARLCHEAQRRYRDSDRDGDGVLEYAESISALRRAPDGSALRLVWPELAEATTPSSAWRGYWYESAQTGYDGKGLDVHTQFCIVARPAVYGETGRLTVVVDETGIVYSNDCGSATATKPSGQAPVGYRAWEKFWNGTSE